ncbi:MAG: DUF4349 domain-containing protein [Anaerolineae bacterium]
MNRQETEQARQLAREKALYRYSSALDRGDFEVVSSILEKAEEDPVLARMLLEVNEVYQAEIEEGPISVTQTLPGAEATQQRRPFDWLLRWRRGSRREGGKMKEDRQTRVKPSLSRGNLIRNGLIVGGVVLGMALICVISFGIYASSGGSGGPRALTARQTEALRWSQRGAYLSFDAVGGETDSYGARAQPPAQPAPPPAATEAPAAAEEPYIVANLPQPVERLVIRNGSISMVVKDTRAAQQSIQHMVAEMAGEGAFVVSSEEQGGIEGSSPYISMAIRVPATRFDEVMDRLAKLAVEVRSRTQSGQDVTEEYVDLQARLESLEAARQRLLKIMEDARTTDELLKAEGQLTQREAEIESIKGRVQYLTQSARLSSIQIELQPYILSQPVVGARWRPVETVRSAFDTLVDSLRNFGDFLIFFGIAILPWLLLIGLVIYGAVRFVLWRVRASREKRTASTPIQE